MSDAAPVFGDYAHRRHVGNVGDVWKHLAWLALLDAVRAQGAWSVLDTHAGEGAYRLGRTGEWTAGFGRVRSLGEARPLVDAAGRVPSGGLPPAADGARTAPAYPGSPWLTVDRSRPGDTVQFVEANPAAAAILATVVPPAAVVIGEGFRVLADWQPAGTPVLLVDPAFVRREEWDEVPAAVSAAVARVPGLTGLLWYPIKAFTRPHQLQHALRRAGTSGTAIDLVSTSVALRRPALAGSGVVVFGAPTGLVARLIAIAGALGPALATRPPEWELRVTAW